MKSRCIKNDQDELVRCLRSKYTGRNDGSPPSTPSRDNNCSHRKWCFDIICDVSRFRTPTREKAVHLGHHVDIIEPMIDDSALDDFIADFREQYRHCKHNGIVKVLLVCPLGNQRSVACAEILKHVLHASGKLVDDIKHISTDNWDSKHMNSCTCCKHPYWQPRFIEVLNKAVKPDMR